MAKSPSPEQIAASGTEEAHQIALFAWANLQVFSGRYPELRWLHAIPNGERRDKVTASRLRLAGVKSGVWDIFLPVSNNMWAGLYIEMKRPKSQGKPAGVLSDKQKDFALHVEKYRYKTEVCYTWEDGRAALESYLDIS